MNRVLTAPTDIIVELVREWSHWDRGICNSCGGKSKHAKVCYRNRRLTEGGFRGSKVRGAARRWIFDYEHLKFRGLKNLDIAVTAVVSRLAKEPE
jgi:hypothetical protein